jgi:hypothetical protein
LFVTTKLGFARVSADNPAFNAIHPRHLRSRVVGQKAGHFL